MSPRTISTYFSSEVAGRWKRVSVSGHIQYLRNFFRYVGLHGWCVKGIAESIDASRLYTYENLPQGPSWGAAQDYIGLYGGDAGLLNKNLEYIRRTTAQILRAIGVNESSGSAA